MTEYQYLFFAEKYTSLAMEALEKLGVDSYAANEAYMKLTEARAALLDEMREIEARDSDSK